MVRKLSKKKLFFTLYLQTVDDFLDLFVQFFVNNLGMPHLLLICLIKCRMSFGRKKTRKRPSFYFDLHHARRYFSPSNLHKSL